MMTTCDCYLIVFHPRNHRPWVYPPGPNPAQPKPYKVITLIIGLSAVDLKGDSAMTCHNCRTSCSKHGKDRKGNQRWRCRQCAHTFTESPESLLDDMRLPFDKLPPGTYKIFAQVPEFERATATVIVENKLVIVEIELR